MIREVGDEVLVLHRAGVLGQDRERVRIPLDENLPGLDRLTELVDVDDRVPLSGSTMCQTNWRSAELVVAR